MSLHAPHHLPEPGDTPHAAAPPSVLRALNAVQHRLDDAGRTSPHGDPAELRATARDLLHAVDLSADVALACVLRNQIAGSYAMRHSIETAVVAVLAARHLHMRPAPLLSLVCAALALHATGRHAPEGHNGGMAGAAHCPRASEPEWFACLLAEHAPDPLHERSAGTDAQAAAHLLRMADRYCAGISPRNYRRALLPGDALARVLELSPDPVLTAAFVHEIGACPPGTAVRLAGGELGVVAHRDGDRPEVFCLRDGAGRTFSMPLPCRVGEDGCTIAAALGEDDIELPISMKQVWGPLASL